MIKCTIKVLLVMVLAVSAYRGSAVEVVTACSWYAYPNGQGAAGKNITVTWCCLPCGTNDVGYEYRVQIARDLTFSPEACWFAWGWRTDFSSNCAAHAFDQADCQNLTCHSCEQWTFYNDMVDFGKSPTGFMRMIRTPITAEMAASKSVTDIHPINLRLWEWTEWRTNAATGGAALRVNVHWLVPMGYPPPPPGMMPKSVVVKSVK